jgi:hypothetical protein
MKLPVNNLISGLVLGILLVGSVAPLSSPTSVQAGAQTQLAAATRKIYLPLIEDQGNVGSVLPTPTPAPTQPPLPTATPKPLPTSTPISSTGGTTILAAGDIAMCGRPGDTQTAALLAQNPGTVLALGDQAYDSGLYTEYMSCYDPTWGPYKSKTYPVPGNHDYLTTGAAGYFQYFGSVAGNPSQGYYSFNLGSWHIIALNSNCVQVGGCYQGNPQYNWLQSDLAANPAVCTLAFWHHPRFSSGLNGDDVAMNDIWTLLYNSGADVVLSGHDHDYERFAPQDPNGNINTSRGIVQFVVGTGGSNFTALNSPRQPNSITGEDSIFGVLKMVLRSGSYSWQYLPVSAGYSDSGTANCH